MPSARTERLWFGGLAFVVFAYVAARAALVPMVHDEATSFIAYAQSGRFLPFASVWDANNHFLSSLCGSAGYRLLGFHPLALRWASVLSYALLACCAWRIGQRVAVRAVRWLLWAALLLCPLLLDFFSLFRGYGPAMALLLLGLERMLACFGSRSPRSLSFALAAFALANGFNLSLVPLWGVALALLLPRCLERGLLARWLLLGALPFISAAALALHMSRLGLLYHGSTSAFAEVTAGSLARYALGADSPWTRAALVLLPCMAAASLMALRARHAWIGLLLLGEALLRIAAARTFGLHYAEDRAALHALLLGVLSVAFAADALALRRRWAWLLALPLAALPVRTLWHTNLSHTALWPEQSIPPRFIARIEALEAELGRPAIVGMHRLAGLPYGLQRRRRGGEGDGSALADLCAPADAWIACWRPDSLLACGFAVADSAPAQGLRLLLRERTPHARVLHEERFSLGLARAERSIGHELPAEAIRAGAVIAEVEGALRAPSEGRDLRLGIAVWDSLGQALHGDEVLFALRRGAWRGERFHSARLIRRLHRAARAELFLWSPDRAACDLHDGRVRLHAAD